MAQYAVLNGGVVVDRREIADWDNYDPRKKEALDEKGDWMPVLRPLVSEGSGPVETLIVETDKVRQVFSYPEPTALDVKNECQRRIIQLTGARDLDDCLIKQSNVQMEVNYLNDKRLNGETLTKGEEAWAAWARNLRVQIRTLRAKSNEIEALDPIPMKYTHDSYWS